MRAVLYTEFGVAPELSTVPDPAPPAHGVVVAVKASGVCRSDWHGWVGHDPDIRLPHVPGHEFAGVVRAIGADVRNFAVGDRVRVRKLHQPGHTRAPAYVRGHVGVIAAKFHNGLAVMVRDVCLRLREESGLNEVALSNI